VVSEEEKEKEEPKEKEKLLGNQGSGCEQ